MIKNTLLAAALVLARTGPVAGQMDPPLEIGRGRIDLVFAVAPDEKLHKLVREWVQSCAHAVTVYYGTFPVDRVLIRIRLFEGRGVRSGQTFGYDGAFIKIAVGRSSTPADFADDWMMTHEMIHLAFPSMKLRSRTAAKVVLIEEPFLDHLAQSSADPFVACIDIVFPRFATVWPACPVIVNHIRDGRIPVTASGIRVGLRPPI